MYTSMFLLFYTISPETFNVLACTALVLSMNGVTRIAPSNSKLSPLPPEPYDRGATIDIPLNTAESLKQKEKGLKAKEAELKKKEQELKRKEEAMRKAGFTLEEKNFPPFCPVIHHDISKEIPIHLQKIQYVAFSTYLGFIVILLWNIIAVTVFWCDGAGMDGPFLFMFAALYFIVCVPVAYFIWYRPLYCAMRTDSALSFAGFFFFYTVHIFFCIYASIAPPIVYQGRSLTGIMPALAVFSHRFAAGILYFVGAGLYVIEALMCFWVIQKVYVYFRSSGKSRNVSRGASMVAM